MDFRPDMLYRVLTLKCSIILVQSRTLNLIFPFGSLRLFIVAHADGNTIPLIWTTAPLQHFEKPSLVKKISSERIKTEMFL